MSDTQSAPPDLVAVGVDGARGGWLAACLHSDNAQRKSATTWRTSVLLLDDITAISDLRTTAGSEPPVAIDVPIGLLDSVEFRACDLAARARLGGAANTVFAPPARYMLDVASDYAAIRERVAELRKTQPGAKSLSAQAAGIAPKVAEVDAFARSREDATSWLFECHPEISFMALNGGEPLDANKHSAAGLVQRLSLVRARFPDVEDRLRSAPWTGKKAQLSDALDAYAALSAAVRCALGVHEVLGDGQVDSEGLVMRMVV